MHLTQHGVYLVQFQIFDMRRQRLVEFLEIARQITGLVNRIDDCDGYRVVLGTEAREIGLPVQVVAQAGLRAALDLHVAEAFAGRAGSRTAGHRLVEIIPGGVYFELGGNIQRLDGFAFGGGNLSLLVRLEHHVRIQRVLDFRLQIERRHLQQPNGLLQLRRHRELLPDSQLQ